MEEIPQDEGLCPGEPGLRERVVQRPVKGVGQQLHLVAELAACAVM